MPNQLDVISVLFFCKKSLLARHAFALFERTTSTGLCAIFPLSIVRMALFKIFLIHIHNQNKGVGTSPDKS